MIDIKDTMSDLRAAIEADDEEEIQNQALKLLEAALLDLRRIADALQVQSRQYVPPTRY